MSSPADDVLARIAASYDEVTYGSLAHQHTHPLRLATAAALRGLPYVPVERCRVLEIGCAEGGNLLLMAECYPDATFVGIDLSPRQVAIAHQHTSAVGLTNVEVHLLDVQDLDDRFGDFDYVVAHGVYSWVPPAVRDRLLGVCSERLTPDGLVYVSYNTYPGWQVAGVVRSAVLAQLDPDDPLPERIAAARRIAEQMAEHADGSTPYGALVMQACGRLATADDGYVAHEFLEVVNDAIPFTHFLDHARRHGLHFVDDLVVRTSLPPHDITSQQYADLVTGTPFRGTVLSARVAPFADAPPPEVLAAMWADTFVEPLGDVVFDDATPAEFDAPRGRLTTTSAVLKRIFTELAAAHPTWSAVRSIVGDDHDAVVGVYGMFRSGYLELSVAPYPVGTTVGERPLVPAATRLQATLGGVVANAAYQRHELEELDQVLVSLLDGTRTVAKVVDDLVALAESGDAEFAKDDGTPLRGAELRDAAALSVTTGVEHFARIGLFAPETP